MGVALLQRGNHAFLISVLPAVSASCAVRWCHAFAEQRRQLWHQPLELRDKLWGREESLRRTAGFSRHGNQPDHLALQMKRRRRRRLRRFPSNPSTRNQWLCKVFNVIKLFRILLAWRIFSFTHADKKGTCWPVSYTHLTLPTTRSV